MLPVKMICHARELVSLMGRRKWQCRASGWAKERHPVPLVQRHGAGGKAPLPPSASELIATVLSGSFHNQRAPLAKRGSLGSSSPMKIMRVWGRGRCKTSGLCTCSRGPRRLPPSRGLPLASFQVKFLRPHRPRRPSLRLRSIRPIAWRRKAGRLAVLRSVGDSIVRSK